MLIVTYDGKLRGFLVSQTDGFKLHHTFRFDGGVSALSYDATHYLLYVAGVPRPASSNKVLYPFTEPKSKARCMLYLAQRTVTNNTLKIGKWRPSGLV